MASHNLGSTRAKSTIPVFLFLTQSMKYINSNHFKHTSATGTEHQQSPKNRVTHPKVGVLITNLGTPQAPTAAALRPYLREFLSDPRVVEFPRFLWAIILHGIILRFRPARAAKAYQKVWTDKGSPLAVITNDQSAEIEQRLSQEFGDTVITRWAMRYGQPSIASQLQYFADNNVRKLFVLPLYPQYSASTTASTFDAIAHDFSQRRWLPELRFNNGYHTNSDYIDALATSIKTHIDTNGMPEKLLFSYHGVPLRYLKNGDPYHCYCLQTTRLVAEKLGLDEKNYLTTFQSRFGREPWLQPYTDHTLEKLAHDGVRSVAVVCPGFSADCLETIEEIDQENREIFIEAGGTHFHYIPALNSNARHIDALAGICKQNIREWIEECNTYNSHLYETLSAEERYNKCPFNHDGADKNGSDSQ